MERKKLKIIIFLLFIASIFVNETSAQNIPEPRMVIDCYGTLEAWKHDASLRDFMATHNCYCPSPTSSPVCSPVTSGSKGSSYTPSPGLKPEQQMQIMMIQGILQPVINSIFQPIFTPPQQGPSPGELQRQREEQLRREAQERFELLSRWHSMRQQYNKNSRNRNKNLSSLLSVDVGPFPEDESGETSTGTPFFNDAASIFGNLVMDKSIEKIEDIGKDAIDKLGEKYKKEWGSKIYEKGLPILKIAVATATEGKDAGGVETVEYIVSLLSKPMTPIQSGIADIGRQIYAKISFGALDKFLEETEEAGKVLGFDFSKDAFKQDFEDSMTTTQRIIYKYLKGE